MTYFMLYVNFIIINNYLVNELATISIYNCSIKNIGIISDYFDIGMITYIIQYNNIYTIDSLNTRIKLI